ncbi:hypothetical protein TNCV_2902321 [Trichonephila clavipes]|nr:hypothetical protein TNCV_2902321 [Trichonephila clavipes]
MALYRSPLTVTLWPLSFLKKYGPMIPPAHKVHQTVSFSGYSDEDIRLDESECEEFEESANVIDNIPVNTDIRGEQQRLRHLLDIVSTDSEDEISDFEECVISEEEEHHIEQFDHSTDSEQEFEETGEQETTNNLIENDSYYLGKDGITKCMHDNDDTLVETKPGVMKLENVNFYNMTKGGVDITDEMCSIRDVSRICNRWPLRIFYYLLNTAGINASILHHLVFPEKEMRRSKLFEDNGMDFVQPQWDM